MSLPGPGQFVDLARSLRAAAGLVEQQARTAEVLTVETVWWAPVADRARVLWAAADGAARCGAEELRVVAAGLDRLAGAVGELAVDMGRAHERAVGVLQEALREALAVDARQGGAGAGGAGQGGAVSGAVRAELASLPPAGSPYWARRVGVPALPGWVLPVAVGPAPVGPVSPVGVVSCDPTRTRWLARSWQQCGVEVGSARQGLAVRGSALPVHELDAYGLRGAALAGVLELVLGPAGCLGVAAAGYADAGLVAVAAADAIDGLGALFLPVVGGVFVGTAQDAAQGVLASFGVLDTGGPDGGGGPDGWLSVAELRAAAADLALPATLRAAAGQLAADPDMFALVQDMQADRTPGVREDRIRAADLVAFLALRDATEVVYEHLPALLALNVRYSPADPEALSPGLAPQDPGRVTSMTLARAAQDTALPAALRRAARWLLEHPVALSALGSRGGAYVSVQGLPTSLGADDLIRVLVTGHAFDGRPAEARAFVASLPVPIDGERGLSLGLVSDLGVKGLANAALTAADGDLSEQVAVIGHLPETTTGVRNALISAMYARMAGQLDIVMNGVASGRPKRSGYSGANWMTVAPWASNGVRSVITGDFRVFWSAPPLGVRQAAADGNQWIFSDIGARYAAFLELYQDGARPKTAELQRFFDTSFRDGDEQVRSAFAAYAQVPLTTDPVRRQELMFQGNLLIGVHEQAGVQRWLEEVSLGPDQLASRYIDLRIGDRNINVQRDLPARATENNQLQHQRFLSLDPAGLGPHQLAPQALAGVSLPPISGVQDRDPSFPVSLAQMAEQGGYTLREVYPVQRPFTAVPMTVRDPAVADSLAGSGARSWTDRDERMWQIVKLFEQTHTDPTLIDVTPIEVGFDQSKNNWLTPSTGLRP